MKNEKHPWPNTHLGEDPNQLIANLKKKGFKEIPPDKENSHPLIRSITYHRTLHGYIEESFIFTLPSTRPDTVIRKEMRFNKKGLKALEVFTTWINKKDKTCLKRIRIGQKEYRKGKKGEEKTIQNILEEATTIRIRVDNAIMKYWHPIRNTLSYTDGHTHYINDSIASSARAATAYFGFLSILKKHETFAEWNNVGGPIKGSGRPPKTTREQIRTMNQVASVLEKYARDVLNNPLPERIQAENLFGKLKGELTALPLKKEVSADIFDSLLKRYKAGFRSRTWAKQISHELAFGYKANLASITKAVARSQKVKRTKTKKH